MQKAIFGILIMGLFLITSCSKSNSTSGNSWIFRTVTYNTVTSQGVAATLTTSNATTSNIGTFGTVTCTFFGTTLPASGNTYTVVKGVPTNNTQVAIAATTAGGTVNYTSTGGNGTNDIVTVSVSNGKVTVTGSGVELVNTASASDSSALTLNITQLQ